MFGFFKRKSKSKKEEKPKPLESQKSMKKEAKFIKKEIIPEKIEKLNKKEFIEEPPVPVSKPKLQKKKGWIKEITLLIILLLLIGILIGSIIFRNQILTFFS